VQGLEAVARLRVSSGLEVDAYGGAFHRRTPTDVDLPALSSDQVQQAPDPAGFWPFPFDAGATFSRLTCPDNAM
jgi:hypothetical protein